jgi:hypothetical protein
MDSVYVVLELHATVNCIEVLSVSQLVNLCGREQCNLYVPTSVIFQLIPATLHGYSIQAPLKHTHVR